MLGACSRNACWRGDGLCLHFFSQFACGINKRSNKRSDIRVGDTRDPSGMRRKLVWLHATVGNTPMAVALHQTIDVAALGKDLVAAICRLRYLKFWIYSGRVGLSIKVCVYEY